MPSDDRNAIRPGGCRALRTAVRRGSLSGALSLLAIAIGSGCQTPTLAGESPAYDPTALVGGQLYRWPLGATVAIHVDTTGQGELGLGLRDAVARGMDGWREVWTYDELRLTIVDDVRRADVLVQLRGAPGLVSVEGCASAMTGTAGITVLCAHGDSARTLPLLSGGDPGRIKVAIEVDGSTATSAGSLHALVAHELGHALGIGGHSPVASDLMYTVPTVSRPSSRDAATLRYVLHRAHSLRL